MSKPTLKLTIYHTGKDYSLSVMEPITDTATMLKLAEILAENLATELELNGKFERTNLSKYVYDEKTNKIVERPESEFSK